MRKPLLVAGTVALAGAAAWAYHVYDVDGRPRRWPGWNATLYMDPEMPANRARAMEDAAAAWTGVEGSAFRFFHGGASSSANLRNVSNGSNDVTFSDLPAWVYAWTVTRSSGADIKETDVVFNTDFEWTTNGSPSDAADVETVAVHEFGHVLGLDHEDALPSVMRSSADASIPYRELTADDEDGIRFLYPSAGGPIVEETHPDLAAMSIEILSGTPGPDAPLTLQAVFQNLTPFPCDSFRAVATLSTARPVTARDPAVGTVDVSLIAASQSRTVNFPARLPEDLAPGTWRLGLLADPDDVLRDSGWHNNIAASEPFVISRAAGAIDLGQSVDAGLGPEGVDAVDLWIGEGTRVVLRARGIRGVRPVLRLLEGGTDEVVAEDSGTRSAAIRWTAPSDGVRRLEFSNDGGAPGRARITTSGTFRARDLAADAPAVLWFPAYGDGGVVLSAVFEGPASPLVCRSPSGVDVTAPGSVAGVRSRLGPFVPGTSGVHGLDLSGEGAASCSILSRTARRPSTLVR
jgi:hypothetical protein